MVVEERFSDSSLTAVSDEFQKLLPVQMRFKHNESTLCYVLGNDQFFVHSCLICMVWLALGRRACSATLSFMGFFLFISVLKLQTKIFLAQSSESNSRMQINSAPLRIVLRLFLFCLSL